MKFWRFPRRERPSRRKPGSRPVVPEVPVDPHSVDPSRVEAFPEAGPQPWLDRPDAESAIRTALSSGRITKDMAQYCRQWREEGYLILPGFFPEAVLDEAWAEYEEAIKGGKLTPPDEGGADGDDDAFPGRTLNPHFRVDAFRRLLKSPEMLKIVGLLLGAKAKPFQTIAGHKGSEQLAHSDSIHMTTYPQGYLVANWIAMEDIHADSGPLEYYPRSHKLPYAYSKDVGITLDEGRAGYDAYSRKYEPHVQRVIAENRQEVRHFIARKGDVLLWHANLLHGGSPRKNPKLSRKALVCHYFARGCVCYHDYTGTLSHLHSPNRKSGESWTR